MGDLLTSTEVAKLAGVGPTAVKRWADAGVLACVKTPGGHRRFERREVERFLRSGGALADPWSDWIEAAAGDGGVAGLQARLFDLRAGRGSWHAAATGVGDLLHEIGDRWAAGTMTVVEEHIASHALQRALATIVETIPLPADAPRVFFASAEGDDHTLGLSLAELCAREAGWRGEWGGPRTRSSDVLDRVRAGGVGMVALSASSFSTRADALAEEARGVGEACRAADVALAFGGAGRWPDAPAYGVRFRDLDSFYAFAAARASRIG